MSRWADWFPITPDKATAFLAAYKRGDAAVMDLLQPWLSKLEDLPLHVQMDKAWETIHRCLTGDRNRDFYFKAGKVPIKWCVLGGKHLLRQGHRTASLVEAAQVPRVAKALAKVEKPWMKERFLALAGGSFFFEVNDEMFEWTWEHFELLPPFFDKVAKDANAVLCTISH